MADSLKTKKHVAEPRLGESEREFRRREAWRFFFFFANTRDPFGVFPGSGDSQPPRPRPSVT
jgi:hypothetical protein